MVEQTAHVVILASPKSYSSGFKTLIQTSSFGEIVSQRYTTENLNSYVELSSSKYYLLSQTQ